MIQNPFEEITQKFEGLSQQLSRIEGLLNQHHLTTSTGNPPQAPDPDRWFNVTELCEYLPDHPKRATVYSWVSLSLIPCHKGTKQLRFSRGEIDAWLKTGRRKTFAELKAETSKRRV